MAGPQASVAAPRPVHHRRETCRGCGERHLEPFLALGPQPLANALVTGPADFPTERFFPLDVVICTTCRLVQLVDVIDPSVLFDHYLYVTGTSETIARHNVEYARGVSELLGLGARDLVVEIASNDGSLLRCFASLGARTLGVEPARNIAALARERGIETVNRFFNGAVGRELRQDVGGARAVIANNVLAHVDDPIDFLSGCRELVTDDGLVVVEVPYAGDMLERVEFDTIYHEHLCYFAVGPLARLAERAGLRIVRVERFAIHGGSMRVYFARGRGDEPEIDELRRREDQTGLTTLEAWQEFGRATARTRTALLDLLGEERAGGRRLAAYGAPAKGNTLLNYCGIGPDVVPFTVDRNPLKVGLLTPGMHLPVLAVDELRHRAPDTILILAWNFADEIVRQQEWHGAGGGRWLVPIPSPRLY